LSPGIKGIVILRNEKGLIALYAHNIKAEIREQLRHLRTRAGGDRRLLVHPQAQHLNAAIGERRGRESARRFEPLQDRAADFKFRGNRHVDRQGAHRKQIAPAFVEIALRPHPRDARRGVEQ
jgi:hypothetical protein